ncbi:ATPase for chromosome partitioning [Bifidobacterium breve CECT 7263]|nr:ATPase for chromosome partitioning [Bifidobacterium breve CECT 7263]
MLNSDRTDTAIPNTEKTKNRKDEKPESGEGWVKTSVSLRASTRRRLKTWAAAHDMRIQEVLEDALDSYLS